ncbi:hypothetical protein [Microbacterium amylolyticum]|uniref:Uncharacterized protein n=1 Tax=Microbacterium amylolyticum TaxID=936337 RepID=A0ABS4ZL05_9MICO|nr:hypothetical protein [Microbacterium amylolyticum]MBP2437897.1 hypothetical protein [Microbacterium amylolyticum]
MCNGLRLEATLVAARIMHRLEDLEHPRSWLARRLRENEMWVRRTAAETTYRRDC